MTESEFLENLENKKDFLYMLIEKNLFEYTVQIITKLSESDNNDDTQIVTDSLSLIENLIEIYPISTKYVCDRTKLLNWLIRKLKNPKKDFIKLFSSEILVTLIQGAPENQKLFGHTELINEVLNIISEYKGKNPADEEEEEILHNLFDSIDNCLLNKENQEIFKEILGIDLMINFMQGNFLIRHLAIKTLNFACQGNYQNCKYLVEIDGLRSVFSYYMGKGMKSKIKNVLDLIEENEEHCISLIATFSKYLTSVNQDRFINKFKENNYEKTERMIEFYKKNEKKLKEYEEASDNEEEDDHKDPELIKDKIYLKKLNKGLLVFQNINFILAYLYSKHDKEMNDKLKSLFKLNDIKLINIKNNLLELISYLDKADTKTDDTIPEKTFYNSVIKTLI